MRRSALVQSNGEVEGPRRCARQATRAHTVPGRPRRQSRGVSRTPPTIVRLHQCKSRPRTPPSNYCPRKRKGQYDRPGEEVAHVAHRQCPGSKRWHPKAKHNNCRRQESSIRKPPEPSGSRPIQETSTRRCQYRKSQSTERRESECGVVQQLLRQQKSKQGDAHSTSSAKDISDEADTK